MADEVKVETEALFAELAELAPAERARRLAALPDSGLAQELRRLLACHDAAGAEFLEPALPPRIGPYRPIAELGRGGMGVVYLALRADPPLERPVALKLLPRLSGAGSAEARALARLEHPNVARFLDAGTAEDGRGYLAMQYIAGIPIDAWCEEQGLSAPERVRLFLKACAAVSYAHQQMVLLCDLKPAHILVDAAGEPQLLDFGIARLLDATGEGSGGVAAYMTPGYASPEQMRGEPLTTASDVYALGAILRRVLGATATPDLEAIAAKAQAADAGARYSSVDALAQDLRRVLNFRPPLARPGSWPHRARLLLRRERTMVLAGGMIGALLIAGLAGTLWQMRRAQREARLAEQRGTSLQQLAAADLLQLDSAIARLPGGTQAREQMVDDSLERLERLAREPGANAATRYDLALGYLKLAQLQGAPYQANLGRTQQALASAQQALRMLRPLGAAQVVEAEMLVGQIETRLERYAAAKTALRQALAAASAGLRRQPADAAAQQQVAAAALALGDPLLYQQHLSQASRLYAQALALSQALVAHAPSDVNALYGLSAAYYRRAGIEMDEALLLRKQFGQPRAAAPLFRRAVEDYNRVHDLSVVLLEAAPGNEEYQRWNASVDSDLATALEAGGAYPAALSAAGKGIAACAALASADPANLEAEFDLAVAYGARAQIELTRAPAAARADFAQAEALGERIYAADPADVENIERLQGMLHIDLTHRPPGAVRTRMARRTLALAQRAAQLDARRAQVREAVAHNQADLAASLLASGDAVAAGKLLQSVRRRLEQLVRETPGPNVRLTAAIIEAAPPGTGADQEAARTYLREAARYAPCTDVWQWSEVAEANWELGETSAAVAMAAHGLAALPDPVKLSAAQIARGLRRVWGRAGSARAGSAAVHEGQKPPHARGTGVV